MAETALLEIKNVYDTLQGSAQTTDQELKVTVSVQTPDTSHIMCPACTQLALYTAQLSKAISDSIASQGSQQQTLSGSNICAVCIDVMKVSSAFSDITADQRKSIVIQAFTNFIKSNKGDQTLIDVVPSFVNAAIDLSNGTITLQEVEDVVEGCCIGFCTTLKKNKSKSS